MEISGVTNQPVITKAALGRALKPVAEIRDDLPARQGQERASRHPTRHSGQPVERLRTAMAFGYDIPRTQAEVSYRAHQAVYAYTALERSEERDYVSSILGVDEYV